MQGTLYGERTLDQVAIARLREFEPKDRPYWLAFSGGKDSVVLLDLARRSGVRFEAHYSLTTCDPPELVRFIKTFDDVVIDRPDTTMWRAVVKKGLPRRNARWCCEIFKEDRGPSGCVVLTGIRWAESDRRAKRRMIEPCNKKRKHFLHPIMDWKNEEVWKYIHERDLRYCSIYDEGWRRIGCVGCPNDRQVERSQARWPRVWAAWKRAARRWWDSRETHNPGQSFEDFWQTWCDRDGSWKQDDCPGLFDGGMDQAARDAAGGEG